jgi:hypothetical protein
MECHEAQPFVSALYDGQILPAEAGEHIQQCPACRAQLRDYSEIDIELRLLASRMPERTQKPVDLSPPIPFSRFLRWQTWTSSVLVPRLAVAAGLAVIIGLLVGLDFVHAQNRGPWFQFQLRLPQQQNGTLAEPSSFRLAQRGYRNTLLYAQPNGGVAAELAVDDIQRGMVRLGLRARRYEGALDSRVIKQELGDLNGHTYVYAPGQTLEAPVEGGGTLLLTGQVLQDRPPSLAWGLPVNPGPDQLILTHPTLARGDSLLRHFDACAMTISSAQTLSLYAPKEGLFVFSLHPLNRAVQGDATWAQLRFRVGSDDYILFSASPITGGDQPRPIWVYRDANYVPPTDPTVPLLGVGEGSSSNFPR